ncbi:MAG: hypothetical protein GXP56_03760, partial [Deltaproteobacteria bacterium]|nr:hypothetical protein [Deltaproteobacteria bacterium]
MKYCINTWIVLIFFLLIFTGCIHEDIVPGKDGPSIASEIKTDSDLLAAKQDNRKRTLEQLKKNSINVQPVLPKYDPLEDHKISFSMVNEKLETVLYLLADTVGMNLMLDQGIAARQNLVTLDFQNVPAKKVLKELTEQFDLDYKIDGN